MRVLALAALAALLPGCIDQQYGEIELRSFDATFVFDVVAGRGEARATATAAARDTEGTRAVAYLAPGACNAGPLGAHEPETWMDRTELTLGDIAGRRDVPIDLTLRGSPKLGDEVSVTLALSAVNVFGGPQVACEAFRAGAP